MAVKGAVLGLVLWTILTCRSDADSDERDCGDVGRKWLWRGACIRSDYSTTAAPVLKLSPG
jgi:hypothetical protein